MFEQEKKISIECWLSMWSISHKIFIYDKKDSQNHHNNVLVLVKIEWKQKIFFDLKLISEYLICKNFMNMSHVLLA